MEVCLFYGMGYLRKTISTRIAAHEDKNLEPDVSMKYSALKGNIRAIVPLYMMFVCCLICSGIGNAQAGQIWFTYVPPYGTDGDLTGEVSGVTTSDHKVLAYIYVGGWWTKPTWAEPMTPINGDGSWTCDITTGGASDTTATQIIAFLIPEDDYDASWEMSGGPTLPGALYSYPYAQMPRTPADRAIHFSGHNWSVKHGFHGPGPNYFSDSEENVWLDGNGWLHLKIAYRSGNWYCSEIIADESPGYGTYVFTVENRMDVLDENTVLGLFTWDTYAPEYNYREIDFEFSKWENPANDIGQFVIQLWDTPGNLHRFDIDYSGPTDITTHVMTWRANGIYFKSYYGDFSLAPPPENVIETWYYTGSDNPPPGGENIRMNFWLVSGNPPINGLDAEVVIKDFQYLTDISDQPGDINNNGGVDTNDLSTVGVNWQDDDCGPLNIWCNRTDLDCDGRVNLTDVARLFMFWLEGV